MVVARALLSGLIAGCIVLPGGARAQPGANVVKSRGCDDCHSAEAKLGPPYQEIAAKYRGDGGAEASLLAKLRNAKGHSKVHGSEAELKSAVRFILKQ
jgi:cytochrome c